MNIAHRTLAWVIFSSTIAWSNALLAQPAAAGCSSCGTVESIRHYTRHGETSGGGAILGGIAGGVLGHQLGSGRGNTAMTVLGAAGGSYAGNEIERHHLRNKAVAWKVNVRMDTGGWRTLSYRSEPPFREGDRVRLMHGRLALLTR